MAVQILKVWNIRLLESIPGDPQQLNEISSSLTTAVTAGGGKASRHARKSKSFKEKDKRLSDSDETLKRAGSFSRFNSYGTGATIGGMALSQGSQPITRSFRDVHARSWTDLPDSQESYFSPPPLPPRPVESSSDEDDPDYAYIDEKEVKGPNGGKVERTASNELDDQLNALKKSIQRENKARRREAEKQRVQTLHRRPRHHVSPRFIPADPQDYLIPVSSKHSQTQSTSSDCRDQSDLSPTAGQELSSSPTDHSPVFVGTSPSLADHAPTLPPRTRTYGVNENTEPKFKGDYKKQMSDPAPPIPPRSPTRDFPSYKSSSSSSLSSSSSHRCPKCRSLRKAKSSVSKTVSNSLDQRPPRVNKEDSRKSMPNLEAELRMRHTHHCCSSQDSSNDQLAAPPQTMLPTSREYLQLVDDKSRGSELGPELDLLSSCLQTLEGLSKPTGESAAHTSVPKKRRNPYDHIKMKSDSSESSRPAGTDLDAAQRSRAPDQLPKVPDPPHRGPDPPHRGPDPPHRGPDPPHRGTDSSHRRSDPSHRAPDPPPRVNTHRPLGLSQSALTSSSAFNLSPRYQGGIANGAPRSPGGTINGHMTIPHSRKSIGQAPPIPPRTTQPLPDHSRQNGSVRHTQTLGRSPTMPGKHNHPLPPRSNSVLDHTHSFHGNSKYSSYGGGSQVDPGSSTVFIHHVKKQGLAHMV